MDECIWHRVEGNQTYVIVINVDDLLMLATKKELDALKALFIAQFKWITMEVSDEVSYLGMQINRRDNQFEVSM
jgi:hypothetical protein